jgi:hypothetical protein
MLEQLREHHQRRQPEVPPPDQQQLDERVAAVWALG